MPDDGNAVQLHAVVGTVRCEFGFYGPFFSIMFAFVAKDGDKEMQPNGARQDDGEKAAS